MAAYWPAVKEASLSGKIKRFPERERQLLKATLRSHEWQSMTKDFRIKTCTDVRREHLVAVAEDVDGACSDFKKDVKTRLELVKDMRSNGEVHVYKGGSHEGSKRVFYRYFMFVRANTTGTYDVFLASLCRKEEEPGFFGWLGKARMYFTSGHGVLFRIPGALLFQIKREVALLQVAQALAGGVITADDEDVSLETMPVLATLRGVVPKGLGDKIIEFEFVEDLIDKGFLIPSEDGSQMTLKFA